MCGVGRQAVVVGQERAGRRKWCGGAGKGKCRGYGVGMEGGRWGMGRRRWGRCGLSHKAMPSGRHAGMWEEVGRMLESPSLEGRKSLGINRW